MPKGKWQHRSLNSLPGVIATPSNYLELEPKMIDPIVAEVQAIRQTLADRFGNDLAAICAHLREEELKGEHKLVSFPPRSPNTNWKLWPKRTRTNNSGSPFVAEAQQLPEVQLPI